ncbi:MAG TPA: hypothetical protein VGM64_09920 [Lacunisphaera sp.]|jgi:hypothetical protein
MNKHNATIDFVGNMPMRWQQTAEGLLIASNILKERREAVMSAFKSKFLSNPTPSPELPKEGQTYWIELMLTGFAIENLMKGLWLANGNTLYKDAQIPKEAIGKAHNLVDLASRASLAVDDAERADLEMLSKIMTGVGRYPMARNETHGTGGASWTYESDKRVTAILARLQEQLTATEAKHGERNALSRVTSFRRKIGEIT